MFCEMVLVSGCISRDTSSWGDSRSVQCDRMRRTALLFQTQTVEAAGTVGGDGESDASGGWHDRYLSSSAD